MSIEMKTAFVKYKNYLIYFKWIYFKTNKLVSAYILLAPCTDKFLIYVQAILGLMTLWQRAFSFIAQRVLYYTVEWNSKTLFVTLVCQNYEKPLFLFWGKYL